MYPLPTPLKAHIPQGGIPKTLSGEQPDLCADSFISFPRPEVRPLGPHITHPFVRYVFVCKHRSFSFTVSIVYMSHNLGWVLLLLDGGLLAALGYCEQRCYDLPCTCILDTQPWRIRQML